MEEIFCESNLYYHKRLSKCTTLHRRTSKFNSSKILLGAFKLYTTSAIRYILKTSKIIPTAKFYLAKWPDFISDFILTKVVLVDQ